MTNENKNSIQFVIEILRPTIVNAFVEMGSTQVSHHYGSFNKIIIL